MTEEFIKRLAEWLTGQPEIDVADVLEIVSLRSEPPTIAINTTEGETFYLVLESE